MSQQTLEDIVQEVLDAAPTGKQIPPLREFQAVAARKLDYEPGLETIRRVLNSLGWYTEGKQSHRWVYKHKRERRE